MGFKTQAVRRAFLKKKTSLKKSWGIGQFEQQPAKNNDRVGNRTLLFKSAFVLN